MDALSQDPANARDETEEPTQEEIEKAKLDDWADAVAEFRLREKYQIPF